MKKAILLCVVLALMIQTASASSAMDKIRAQIKTLHMLSMDQAPTTTVQVAGSSNGNFEASIDEAIAPLSQWLKDFKKKEGAGNDLYSAARATVKPLLQRLRDSQEKAVERLRDSNEMILRHVEQVTVDHVYDLLRAEKVSEDKASDSAKRAEEIKEAADKAKAAEQALEVTKGIAKVAPAAKSF